MDANQNSTTARDVLGYIHLAIGALYVFLCLVYSASCWTNTAPSCRSWRTITEPIDSLLSAATWAASPDSRDGNTTLSVDFPAIFAHYWLISVLCTIAIVISFAIFGAFLNESSEKSVRGQDEARWLSKIRAYKPPTHMRQKRQNAPLRSKGEPPFQEPVFMEHALRQSHPKTRPVVAFLCASYAVALTSAYFLTLTADKYSGYFLGIVIPYRDVFGVMIILAAAKLLLSALLLILFTAWMRVRTQDLQG